MVCKQGRGMWLDTVLGLGAGGPPVEIVLAHFSHSFRNVVKLLKTFNLFSGTENLLDLICMYCSSPILFQFNLTTRTIVNTSVFKTTRFDLVYCIKFFIFSRGSS